MQIPTVHPYLSSSLVASENWSHSHIFVIICQINKICLWSHEVNHRIKSPNQTSLLAGTACAVNKQRRMVGSCLNQPHSPRTVWQEMKWQRAEPSGEFGQEVKMLLYNSNISCSLLFLEHWHICAEALIVPDFVCLYSDCISALKKNTFYTDLQPWQHRFISACRCVTGIHSLPCGYCTLCLITVWLRLPKHNKSLIVWLSLVLRQPIRTLLWRLECRLWRRGRKLCARCQWCVRAGIKQL